MVITTPVDTIAGKKIYTQLATALLDNKTTRDL